MQIGLDLGTSAIKGIAWRDGAVLAEAARELSLQSPQPYWSEQSPEDWWRAARAVLAELVAALGPTAQDISAIGLSGQMHGAVLLDARGAVIRPAMLWNDGRAHAECAEITAACPEAAQIGGVPPLPGFTGPKLRWLARHAPQDHARIAHVLLPKDYIGLRLHGRYVTDPSDAAGTLLFDQAERRWSARLCRASKVNPGWLPELQDGTAVAGRLLPQVASELGLPPGIPIAAGAGDAAAGAVSVGATEYGAGMISLGTSGQLLIAGERYRPNPGRMVHAYAHTVPGRWVQMAAMLNGARPMAWFASVANAPIGTLLGEAAEADPARVPLFLPYLTGERSPHGDPHIRGAFYGLEDRTTRGAMMRAVAEAVAFCFADAVDSFGDAATSTALPAIGGGTRSDFVLQTIADATDRAVARADGAAAGPAIGAAKLAAVAVGALEMSDLARTPGLQTPFLPVEAPHLQERLARWRALYAALAPFAHG